MNALALALIFVVLIAVVAFVSGPLRQARSVGPVAQERPGGGEATRADLEASREAKLREIRDTELDFRTGKLSDEDYRLTDGALRTEAAEILRRLDGLADAR